MKAIGILKNPDGTGAMTIYYNGSGEPMTAENEELVEDVGYTPKSEADARKAACTMWGYWPWDFELLDEGGTYDD